MHVAVKKTKVLTETGKVLAEPFIAIAKFLAGAVLTRVGRGEGPNRRWKTYAASAKGYDASRHGKDRRFFWVEPRSPQPLGEGFVFAPKIGEKAGWAAYRSAKAYYALRGLVGKPHTRDETGRLLSLAAIRTMSPRHMRVAFFGTHHKGQSAKSISYLSSRHEDVPLLEPSASEIETVQRMIAASVTEATIEGARLGEAAQKIALRGAAVESRFKRLSKLQGD